MPRTGQRLNVSSVKDDDPFKFAWSVWKLSEHDTESAYEWSEDADGRLRLYPRLSSAGGTLRYIPPGLFREFAQTPPTLEGLRDFAGRRGDLFQQWDIRHARVDHERLVGGTSLEVWRGRLSDFSDLLLLWTRIQDRRRHKELAEYVERRSDDITFKIEKTWTIILAGPEATRIKRHDLATPARMGLVRQLNRRLADLETPTVVVPHIAFSPDGLRQRIIFSPSNLLSEMYLRFAQEVAGEHRLKQCSECPTYFEVGAGADRAHKITCGPRCRQRRIRRLAREAS